MSGSVLLYTVDCDGLKSPLTHVENSHFVQASHRCCLISEPSRAEGALCSFWLQATNISQQHKYFLLSKYRVYWTQQQKGFFFLAVKLREEFGCGLYFPAKALSFIPLTHCSYITYMHSKSVLYCVSFQRWRRELPVHSLSHSEGGRGCQGDNQESVSSQHRPVSPALLVLHARLRQDGNTEGDLKRIASP